MEAILLGHVVGRSIQHIRFDEDDNKAMKWNGKIEKKKKRGKVEVYRIAYWSENGDYDDAEDFDVAPLKLAADFLLGDLVLC